MPGFLRKFRRRGGANTTNRRVVEATKQKTKQVFYASLLCISMLFVQPFYLVAYSIAGILDVFYSGFGLGIWLFNGYGSYYDFHPLFLLQKFFKFMFGGNSNNVFVPPSLWSEDLKSYFNGKVFTSFMGYLNYIDLGIFLFMISAFSIIPPLLIEYTGYQFYWVVLFVSGVRIISLFADAIIKTGQVLIKEKDYDDNDRRGSKILDVFNVWVDCFTNEFTTGIIFILTSINMWRILSTLGLSGAIWGEGAVILSALSSAGPLIFALSSAALIVGSFILLVNHWIRSYRNKRSQERLGLKEKSDAKVRDQKIDAVKAPETEQTLTRININANLRAKIINGLNYDLDWYVRAKLLFSFVATGFCLIGSNIVMALGELGIVVNADAMIFSILGVGGFAMPVCAGFLLASFVDYTVNIWSENLNYNLGKNVDQNVRLVVGGLLALSILFSAPLGLGLYGVLFASASYFFKAIVVDAYFNEKISHTASELSKFDSRQAEGKVSERQLTENVELDEKADHQQSWSAWFNDLLQNFSFFACSSSESKELAPADQEKLVGAGPR